MDTLDALIAAGERGHYVRLIPMRFNNADDGRVCGTRVVVKNTEEPARGMIRNLDLIQLGESWDYAIGCEVNGLSRLLADAPRPDARPPACLCPELDLLALPAELPDRFRVTLPYLTSKPKATDQADVRLAADCLRYAQAIGDLQRKTMHSHGFTCRADKGVRGDWHYEFYRQTP